MPRNRKPELELLERLRDELERTTVDASHTASVWVHTGLNIAATIVQELRTEILCEEVLRR